MKIKETSRRVQRLAVRALLVPALTLALVASPWGSLDAEASDHKAAELQARKAFTSGEYEKALEIYVDLYDETHHPTYLRNIARCHQTLGHAEKAIAGFREYLRKAKNLTPEQQTEIEKYIAEMEELKRKEAASSSPPAPSPARADAAGGAAESPAPATAADGVHGLKRAEVVPRRPTAGERQPQPAGVDLSLHAAPPEKDNEVSASSPFYTRVWFWAGVGVLAAGIVTTIVIVSANRGPAYGNLGYVVVPPAQQ